MGTLNEAGGVPGYQGGVRVPEQIIRLLVQIQQKKRAAHIGRSCHPVPGIRFFNYAQNIYFP